MAAVRIRPMVETDLEAVTAIDRASFPSPWRPESYRFELVENPHSHCWVADKSGQIIGALVGWLVIDEFQIGTIAVDRAHRRQGIGHRLLATALKEAKAQGAKTAILEVRQGNLSAQSLYERFGFRIVGDRPRFYSDGEDAFIMTLPDLDKTIS